MSPPPGPPPAGHRGRARSALPSAAIARGSGAAAERTAAAGTGLQVRPASGGNPNNPAPHLGKPPGAPAAAGNPAVAADRSDPAAEDRAAAGWDKTAAGRIQ